MSANVASFGDPAGPQSTPAKLFASVVADSDKVALACIQITVLRLPPRQRLIQSRASQKRLLDVGARSPPDREKDLQLLPPQKEAPILAEPVSQLLPTADQRFMSNFSRFLAG